MYLRPGTHMRMTLLDVGIPDQVSGRIVLGRPYLQALADQEGAVVDFRPMCRLCIKEGNPDMNPPKYDREQHCFTCLKHKKTWTKEMPCQVFQYQIDYWKPKKSQTNHYARGMNHKKGFNNDLKKK